MKRDEALETLDSVMHALETAGESDLAEKLKGVYHFAGGAEAITKAEIYRKDQKGRYIHSTSERQKMLVELNSRQ